jgi:hypothetical protein
MNFKTGQRVKSHTHQYEGTIIKIHRGCPESDDWIKRHSIAIRPEAVRGKWYTILLDTGLHSVLPQYDLILHEVVHGATYQDLRNQYLHLRRNYYDFLKLYLDKGTIDSLDIEANCTDEYIVQKLVNADSDSEYSSETA